MRFCVLARHVGDLVDEQRAAMRFLQRTDLPPPARPSPSTPNSSISIRSGVMAAALITTNGPLARAEAARIMRAVSPLPEPEGPTIMMRLLVGATRSIAWRSWFITEERPTSCCATGVRCLRSRTSRFSRERLQRALGDEDQPVGVERLLDEVVGALLDGRHRRLDGAVAGDHHHRHFRVVLLDQLQELQAVELGALQPDVEEDQMRAARLDGGERLVAVLGGAGAVALVLQYAGHQPANVGLVIDDQNVGRHESGSP